MKKSIFFAVMAIVLMATSCMKHSDNIGGSAHNREYVMTLANDSPFHTMWYIPEHGDNGCDRAGELPDLKPDENLMLSLAPKTSFDVYVSNDGIESPLETYHPEDKVVIYVFDPEVLSTEDWNDIKADGKWLEKFSLTVKEVAEADKIVKFKR